VKEGRKREVEFLFDSLNFSNRENFSYSLIGIFILFTATRKLDIVDVF
jgi:hypothetical protein